MKKKKSVLIAAVLCVLAMMLTGCIRMSVDVTIKNNGKADVSMLMAMEESFTEMGDVGDVFEDADEMAAEGWTIEEYREDGYIGYIASQKDVDFTESETGETIPGFDLSSGVLRKDGSLYILDIPMESSEEDEVSEYASAIKAQGGYMVMRITFPSKPENHNATSVSDDGKTLEWDLLGNPQSSIHAEFKMGGGLFSGGARNLPVIIIIAAIILAVIALVLVLVLGRKKKSVDIPEMQAGAPYQQYRPYQPYQPYQQGGTQGYQGMQQNAPQQGVYQPQQSAQQGVFQPQQSAPQQGVFQPEQTAFQPQEQIPQERMTQQPRFCVNCGTPLAEGTAFCPHCGQKVGPV